MHRQHTRPLHEWTCCCTFCSVCHLAMHDEHERSTVKVLFVLPHCIGLGQRGNFAWHRRWLTCNLGHTLKTERAIHLATHKLGWARFREACAVDVRRDQAILSCNWPQSTSLGIVAQVRIRTTLSVWPARCCHRYQLVLTNTALWQSTEPGVCCWLVGGFHCTWQVVVGRGVLLLLGCGGGWWWVGALRSCCLFGTPAVALTTKMDQVGIDSVASFSDR